MKKKSHRAINTGGGRFATKCSAAIKTRAEQVEELQAGKKKSERAHTCERPWILGLLMKNRAAMSSSSNCCCGRVWGSSSSCADRI